MYFFTKGDSDVCNVVEELNTVKLIQQSKFEIESVKLRCKIII